MAKLSQVKMENLGELDIIARYNAWRFFCTLTFRGVEPNENTARKLIFAHLYRSADVLRVPFRKLAWVLRVERGEQLGRLHYHALFGGAFPANLGAAFTLNALWESLNHRCGFARHRVYDLGQNGAAYVASCLSSSGSLGADFYESCKFGSVGTDLTLSGCLCRAIGDRTPKSGKQENEAERKVKTPCRQSRVKETEELASKWEGTVRAGPFRDLPNYDAIRLSPDGCSPEKPQSPRVTDSARLCF